MFKVLISDAMSNVAEQIFEEKNISVDVITGLSEEELIKIIKNTNNAEDNTDDLLDLLSNVFKLYHDGSGLNTDGSEYIYMAFAEAPLVNSNGIPNNAR